MTGAKGRYFTQKASDVGRDGCGIELFDGEEQIGEVFRSDRHRRMTVTLWREDVDLDLVDMLIARAKEELPPYLDDSTS